jgi:hypothetical protein
MKVQVSDVCFSLATTTAMLTNSILSSTEWSDEPVQCGVVVLLEILGGGWIAVAIMPWWRAAAASGPCRDCAWSLCCLKNSDRPCYMSRSDTAAQIWMTALVFKDRKTSLQSAASAANRQGLAFTSYQHAAVVGSYVVCRLPTYDQC